MGFPLLCQGIADLGASHVRAAFLFLNILKQQKSIPIIHVRFGQDPFLNPDYLEVCLCLNFQINSILL